MKQYAEHFKKIPYKKLESYLKRLKKVTDLDKIDLMSADSLSDLDTLKQFVKDEYGIAIEKKPSNKKEILVEVDKEITENVKQQQKYMIELLEQPRIFQGSQDELMKEIIRYSPYTENVVISTLVAVSQKINIINLGEKGTGKTFNTKDLLDNMNIPYNEIKGHITPKRFYELAKLYNGTLILIDESANMLTDNEIRNLLLSLLNKERVYWLEDYFDSNSTIIFNSNYMQNNPIMRAVMDRCITNHIKLESTELKTKLKEAREYQPKTNVWEQIRSNLFRNEQLNEIETDIVYEILDLSEIKSMRDKWRFMNIAECSKKVINSLDFLKYFTKIDKISFILANPDLKKSEKVKMIAIEKGVGERQAQRIVKKGG